MNEGWAIVISALISVAGVVIATIGTQFFNWRQRQDDFEYQYSLDLYNKKLAIYEEVIRTLDSMRDPDTRVLYMSSFKEINEMIAKYIHKLRALIDRLHLYGSPDSREILYSCIDEIQYKSSEAVDDVPELQAGSFSWASLSTIVRNIMIDFTKLVSIETCDGFANIRRIKHRSKSKIAKQPNRKSGDNLNRNKHSPK